MVDGGRDEHGGQDHQEDRVNGQSNMASTYFLCEGIGWMCCDTC